MQSARPPVQLGEVLDMLGRPFDLAELSLRDPQPPRNVVLFHGG